MKLKYSQVKTVRESQLEKQNYLCALCQQPLTVEEAVLDHDHKTGAIRGVIHRGDNMLLGKIENNMARNRVDISRLAMIAGNLIKYLTADPITEYLHPKHQTAEERKMKAYKKKKGGSGKKRGY